MKTIIAGSRSVEDMAIIELAVKQCGWNVTKVISGCARGVDKLGEIWAAANNIRIERHPSDWDTHGKSAGYKRNTEMARCADALIAIWDGESKGTKHMIEIAKQYDLLVYVYSTKGAWD